MNSALDLRTNDTPSDDREKETPDSKTTLEAIVALPLSFKLPSDGAVAIASTSSGRKRRTAETPEGWICEARTRKNGVVDKFYYHKETNIRCRSLREVERYSLHGIRPGPKSKEKEKELITAAAAAENKEIEEIRLRTETRREGVAGGGKDKGKAKIHHVPLNKNEHQFVVEKVLAEAWHNMMQPMDIRTEAWEELEREQQETEQEEIMEMMLQEEREKMIRKFKEERKELERKFEEERAQLHQWMKDEIDYRIQLQLDAIIPTVLQQGKNIPPTSGDSAGI